MAGIYIHVPFCKKKCNYCDFYSVGEAKMDNHFTDFVLKELNLRNPLIADRIVKTIYFGGGTPSLLPVGNIKRIISGLGDFFVVDPNAEITIEVNPDDVTLELAEQYHAIGINRVSIGVQSFNNNELVFLGRRHDASKAVEAIRIFRAAGIANISIDLIYGLPNSTLKSWEHSLNVAFGLDIQHLSCYHLTYEEGTPLTRRVAKGAVMPLDEEMSKAQFDLLRELSHANDFVHYEISNLAKPGYTSKHNSGYWLGEEYLGLGPSAHSFNRSMRWWNPSSITGWGNEVDSGNFLKNTEAIDEAIQFNELLITRLRTMWGVNLNEVANGFSIEIYNHLRKKIIPFTKSGKIIMENNILKILPNHYFVSDSIVAELLIV
ncbi:MAG TPA: radical SAM family heme chaperone HemW [Bacteroidales bacterium]|nr:radical SAM family heme chaperone HemW [Bacteroidales bacterium]